MESRNPASNFWAHHIFGTGKDRHFKFERGNLVSSVGLYVVDQPRMGCVGGHDVTSSNSDAYIRDKHLGNGVRQRHAYYRPRTGSGMWSTESRQIK